MTIKELIDEAEETDSISNLVYVPVTREEMDALWVEAKSYEGVTIYGAHSEFIELDMGDHTIFMREGGTLIDVCLNMCAN